MKTQLTAPPSFRPNFNKNKKVGAVNLSSIALWTKNVFYEKQIFRLWRNKLPFLPSVVCPFFLSLPHPYFFSFRFFLFLLPCPSLLSPESGNSVNALVRNPKLVLAFLFFTSVFLSGLPLFGRYTCLKWLACLLFFIVSNFQIFLVNFHTKITRRLTIST